jgi:hypothetical protein
MILLLKIQAKERNPMQVLVNLRMPNNTIASKTYYGTEAHINPHGVLQIYRGRSIIAEFPSDSYLSWEYVLPAPPLQPTASRAQVLLQHPKV